MKPQHNCNVFEILHELPLTFVVRSSYHEFNLSHTLPVLFSQGVSFSCRLTVA